MILCWTLEYLPKVLCIVAFVPYLDLPIFSNENVEGLSLCNMPPIKIIHPLPETFILW